jgi:predicted phosphodiesterase
VTATGASRVAALYDVHGNVFALEATLAEARSEGADLVVFGGDLAWGPFPRATVERAMDPGLPALYVRGNADRSVAGAAEAEEGWVAEITNWCRAQLDPRQREFLLGQAETVTVEVGALGAVLFCHGSPRGDEEVLTSLTSPERLAAALEGVTAGVVVCGHTHVQLDRASGSQRVVNAGSVGMPYEGRPGAYWCLLDGGGISLRRTDYDVSAAAEAAGRSGCPYAADLARELRSPPEPDAVIAGFEARHAG